MMLCWLKAKLLGDVIEYSRFDGMDSGLNKTSEEKLFLIIIRCLLPKFKSLANIILFRYGNHILKIIRKYEMLDYFLKMILKRYWETISH